MVDPNECMQGQLNERQTVFGMRLVVVVNAVSIQRGHARMPTGVSIPRAQRALVETYWFNS